MVYDLDIDPDYLAIAREMEQAKGWLNDAWVTHNNRKWHPFLIKDQDTGVRGFGFRPKNEWGEKSKVKEEKLPLLDFLRRLAYGSFPSAATIRCKYPGGTNGNGQELAHLEKSTRLENLLERIKQGAQPSVSEQIPVSDPAGLGESEERAAPLGNPASDDGALSGTGYCDDPAARKAIEAHAVQQAREFYERHGYLVTELGKPFDLLCQRPGETLHVEVKGSRFSMQEILLTANEVKDARNPGWVSDLFLVDNISLEINGEDRYNAAGGRCRRASGWIPEENQLTPTEYRYKLPPIADAE